MDLFSTLLAFLLLSSAVVEASNIALSSQLYWHTILPNTPMPKAIRDLLHSDVENEKTVDPVRFVLDGIPDNQFVIKRYYQYSEPVSADALANNPVATLFFLEKDLHPGAKMTLHFKTSPFKAAFLPRRMAESIPFSFKKLPEILQYFSINPTSIESESVANNLQMCEEPEIHKEHKHCATSLESMVDFATSNLGTLDLSVLSTKVGSEGRTKQEYTIAPSGVRKMAGLDLVGCHILAHPYAVFFCHSTRKARAYTIQVKGADGAVVEAAAVCHADTSDWNPNYLAFQALKVSPGPPVCHFLPPDHVVWAHSN